MSSGVPEGWIQSRFDNFAVLQRGFDLPIQQRTKGKYLILGANGIVGTHELASVEGPGVITGRSGSIGKVWFIENDFWALNTSLYVKDFYNNYVKFVYYYLSFFNLSRFSTGTGVPTLNRNDVHLTVIDYPPLPEQKKIAAILSSVDAVIEKTQAQIDKLKDLKTGMMQELLSPREGSRQAELMGYTQFKDSPLGRIPVEWETVSFFEMIYIQSGQVDPKKENHKKLILIVTIP